MYPGEAHYFKDYKRRGLSAKLATSYMPDRLLPWLYLATSIPAIGTLLH
jgi:hypothetical protein